MRSHKPGLAEYNLRGYGAMIADRVRMDAYRDALARSVKPGDVVLDIGAGTGIMSLLACRFGARVVHAVEPSDALAVGRELAAANGYGDRIEFHYKSSFDLALAERADVMVSDLRGIVPLYAGHLPAIVDARRRLLRPGGIQIPQRDTLMAQLVSDAALHEETIAVWSDRVLGLDLSAALRWATHGAHKADLTRAGRLGTPRAVIELDYRTLESPSARGQAEWMIDTDGIVHGLGVWFDATLVDGVGFSNAPDQPRAIYGQMFFPFSEPLRVQGGDRAAVTLAATHIGHDYVWQWHATVTGTGGRRFERKQSSFQGAPVDPARLGRRASGYVPEASTRTRAAARVLSLMGQRLSVEEIAARLAQEFSGELDARAARELVGDLCDWLGG